MQEQVDCMHYGILIKIANTVKFVYKDHPREQQNVVFIHRWSLYAGSIAWKVHIT